MRKRIEWKPETLDEVSWRVMVIGGWLVGHAKENSESMCFVPDKEHDWSLIQPPKPETQAPTVNSKDFDPA